jgi:ubiquinone/menaquinone biosynthesis C-methylase UbiE
MLTYLLCAVVFFELLVIIFLFTRFKNSGILKPVSTTTPISVGEYYNETTDKFLNVYGEIIQAFRTKNIDEYLDYTILNAKITDGMRLLDAGCGVCGPAAYFANKLPNISIDACSVSEVQVEKAKEKINQEKLHERVNVKVADYHTIDAQYENNIYDRVYFLESFGHSNDKTKLIRAARNVLKPGGMIYIKDLFRREVTNEWEQLRINNICEQINHHYHYQISDLNDVLDVLRKQGYILHFVKVPEVELSAFEHLTISNDFQNLFDIGKIETWDDYVFPIDFFEILAEKPKHDLSKDMHLYFMNKQS